MSQVTKNSYDLQQNATHFPTSANHYEPTNCDVGTEGLTSGNDAATYHYDAYHRPYDYQSPMPHPWYPSHSYYPYYTSTSTSSPSSQAPPNFNFSPYCNHASNYQNQNAGMGMLYGHQKPASVTHFDDITQHTRAKPKRRKKSKDKPKRPLSAYNIFFKEERRRILAEATPKNSFQKNSDADLHDEGECTPNEKVSRKTKKTPHGKIGFEDLAKLIGDRWRKLTPEQFETYKAKADKESERYAKEMKEYKSRCKVEESLKKDQSKTSAP